LTLPLLFIYLDQVGGLSWLSWSTHKWLIVLAVYCMKTPIKLTIEERARYMNWKLHCT
jgi:hypothetical protein